MYMITISILILSIWIDFTVGGNLSLANRLRFVMHIRNCVIMQRVSNIISRVIKSSETDTKNCIIISYMNILIFLYNQFYIIRKRREKKQKEEINFNYYFYFPHLNKFNKKNNFLLINMSTYFKCIIFI